MSPFLITKIGKKYYCGSRNITKAVKEIQTEALDDQKAKIIEIVEKTGEDDMLKDYNGVYINFVKIGIRLYKAKVVNNILKEFEEVRNYEID